MLGKYQNLNHTTVALDATLSLGWNDKTTPCVRAVGFPAAGWNTRRTRILAIRARESLPVTVPSQLHEGMCCVFPESCLKVPGFGTQSMSKAMASWR